MFVRPSSLAVCFTALGLVPVCSGRVHAQDVVEETKPASAKLQKIKLSTKKKIVLISGRRSHGYGSHEFNAGNLLLAVPWITG